ncbi:MAG TPA: NADH-quinone oxidoreductase subunit C [Rhizomicrobium sp.]|nr:NADH-quinone oxidoreductase subunit C [Rhizomicrobium sp.]
MAEINTLGEKIAAALPGAVRGQALAFGELTLEIEPGEIARVTKCLRDEFGFTVLIDICGVDWPQRPMRFDVVYHLLSLTGNARIRLKLHADESTPVPTVTGVFAAASWYERETFDMYGITFADHPDLRRLLTDYGFSGYPLRKDFPLTGFVELRYDDELKRVTYRPVQLVQEFREFDFMSPWEGAPYILPGDEKATPK